MSEIRDLWNNNEKIERDLPNVEAQEAKYIDSFNKVNNLLLIGLKKNEYATDFEHLDEYIVSDNEQYYYKQWRLELVDAFPTGIDIDTFLDLYMPSVTYYLIYSEPTENTFSYYATGQEMQEVSCYEIHAGKLYLNLSVYIKKPFGGADIINPQVRVDIVYKPFFDVKQ